jgi:hypothetical protein
MADLKILFQHLPRGAEEAMKTSVRIAVLRAEIRIQDLPKEEGQ